MAKSKIDKTIRKIVADTQKTNTPISLTKHDLPGDPNCEFCDGGGYLRADVAPGHPNFGKLEICSCRNRDVAEQARERLFSMSHLDELKDLTFENFKPRGRRGLGDLQATSIEMAFNQAHVYANSLKGWLLLEGAYGCGKTHLAASVANFAVSMSVPTLFLTVPDLLDMLRFSYSAEGPTFEERFNEIKNAKLLILDDFGTQNATDWAQEKLFQIINYRYINKLPLVVTTNLNLSEIEARIRSRLQDPELVSNVRINAPDYRRPTDDMGHSALSSLDILANKEFGNIDERRNEGLTAKEVKTLERALKTAHKFSEKPKGWLIFMGGYGCGKTHLAASIANYRAKLGAPPLFIMVPDLLDHLRATFSPKSEVSYDRRFDEIRTSPLLVLDDLGTQSMTPWVREKLYQLFNYRYNAQLPTIITTADSLEEIDERIRSRILDKRLCKIHLIDLPAYYGTTKK